MTTDLTEEWAKSQVNKDGSIKPWPADSLKERLLEIANSDYVEPDPTTGEAYELNGRVIVSAIARIEALEKEIAHANSQLMANQRAVNVAIATLEAENKRLREALDVAKGFMCESAAISGGSDE